MGKKDDNVAPPAYVAPPDTSANDAMLQQVFGLMSQMALQQPEMPQIPDTPAIQREPIVNWAEKNKELLAKTKADYTLDSTRRKGRGDTVLTSPLLDSEDTTTTSASLIAGA